MVELVDDLFRELTCGINVPNTFLKEFNHGISSTSNQQIPQNENNTLLTTSEIKIEDEDEDDANIVFKDKPIVSEEKLKRIQTEKINRLKKLNGIHVNGKKDIPNPIEKFQQLIDDYKISPKLYNNIVNCGYKTPTSVQMQAIPSLLCNNSIVACAPTGSGKTAAFLIPIINDLKAPQQCGFRALILCPTRELAKQTQRECLRLVEGGIDLKISSLGKTYLFEKTNGTTRSKKFDILVTTPNRICYLLSQDPPRLQLDNVKWLIIDEADKLFEEGTNSFRIQFDKIYEACTHTEKICGLFSATSSKSVIKWSRKHLKPLTIITIGERNSAKPSVYQEFQFVGSESGKLMAFRNLVHKGMEPPVLVFVDTKERAIQLYSELMYDGINIDVIHGDRTQQERDKIVNDYREGNIWILICTELISRGIDFKGVNLVINYDFPPSEISYIHRIGRTGRADRTGKAITFFTKSDSENLRSIASIMHRAGGKVPDYMLKMKKYSKREKKRIAKNKPKREDISTKIDDKSTASSSREVATTASKKRGTAANKKNKKEKEEAGKYVKYNPSTSDITATAKTKAKAGPIKNKKSTMKRKVSTTDNNDNANDKSKTKRKKN